MTDLEMVKRCAEKMGWSEFNVDHTGKLIVWNCPQASTVTFYDPLHDDAQAMALVKKLRLDIDSGFDSSDESEGWSVCGTGSTAKNADLNRAIVECVAKLP